MDTEYHLECPDNCSLKVGTEFSDFVSQSLVSKSLSHRQIIAEVAKRGGGTMSRGTLSRHTNHIVISGAVETPSADVPEKEATNVEILESIIQKGFANRKNWKPTISDTIKAMEFWFRLTQGNPFDELLDTLAAASVEEDPSLGAADEQEDVIDPEG